MRPQLPMLVKAWFALDLLLILLPPLHWIASGADPLFGLPRSLVYLAGVGTCIASSVVVAYVCDRGLGAGKLGTGKMEGH
jgi:hypothetical protein